MAARSPPPACCCSLQQSNRPPVQRQLPSRAEPALRKKLLHRVDVAGKRSAEEEDDFREETGDKEDCGNDRTLALPRTRRKRLTEDFVQSVLRDSILFPKTKEEEKKILNPSTEKVGRAFSGVVPMCRRPVGEEKPRVEVIRSQNKSENGWRFRCWTSGGHSPD